MRSRSFFAATVAGFSALVAVPPPPEDEEGASTKIGGREVNDPAKQFCVRDPLCSTHPHFFPYVNEDPLGSVFPAVHPQVAPIGSGGKMQLSGEQDGCVTCHTPS